MKSKIKKIIPFIILFSLIFCYFYFISCLYGDEIWNYGFSYNIATGLIPYKDFNLVITPLYPMVASIFIKIFGAHLYSIHIFNSLIISLMIYICYFKINKKVLILIPFILLNGYPGYNILTVFFIFILLLLLDIKIIKKDIIIAFIVSLLFLTKQTIGICLFIPMIYYSKNKLKSLIAFTIPIIIFIIYLLYNNALYEFIDYCFLGLFNFGNSNGIYFFLPLEIIIYLVIFIKLIKSKFSNQKLFYLLMFQIITIPIVDDYHFMLGLIPIMYYYLSTKEIENYKIKYYFIMSLFFCFLWNFYLHNYEIGHLYSNKNSYLYGRNIPKYEEKSVNEISDYINDIREDYDYVYLFSANAYWIKLNINYPLTKYDLINNGNMGYYGSKKYIKEIDKYCKKNKCAFVLYKHEFRNNSVSQTNKELVKYVENKYIKKENINSFNIYISN